MKKPFTSYKQQLKKLRTRGVIIPPGSSQSKRAIKLLRRAGYYSIINGYKDIFLQYPSRTGVEDIYKANISFDAIYSLFMFDRNMRSIILRYILITEGIMKSHISYYFSKKYETDFNYLNINNFNPHKIEVTTKLINNISSVIQADTNSQKDTKGQIPHYLKKHKCLPLWVLMRKLTFGTMSYFYSCMEKDVQSDVVKEIIIDFNKEYPLKKVIFSNFEAQLSDILKFINLFRNVCAHEDRLYNVEYKVKSDKTKKIQTLRISLSHMTSPINFNSKLYSLIAVLKIFLTKEEFITMIKQIEDEINKLSKFLSPQILNEVLIKAGFPKQWQDKL